MKMRILKFTLITISVIVVLFAGYYRFWFLRCPLRKAIKEENIYVSPANGLVASITPWNDSTIKVLKGKYGVIDVWTNDVDTAGTMISIVMNVTNVHYQRAPQSGKVVSVKYVEGKFNNAVANDNPFGIRFENEHNEMLFETQTGKRYKVIQIAGLLARRIVDFVETGEEKKKGDLIGLIKLGSQVTVILPSGVTPKVTVGQTILDGDVFAEEE
jgi:phosphatidylserine decarboxylase